MPETTGPATPSTPSAASGHCTGCGRPTTECLGCGRALDPPRFCPQCGRRMTVVVIPTGWVARCRDHGEMRPRS